MRTKILAPVICTLIVAALTSCGSDTTAPSESPSSPASSSPTTGASADSDSEGLTIDATIRGDDLEPNGERLQAKVGEPITINIDADRDGELHVHSTPEQELEYHEGANKLTLTIETPGIVEIEDHVADKVLVSLEVS
ncbi:MAG: hypothetical protein QM655_08405 [Nocardioidaceae bacterium]